MMMNYRVSTLPGKTWKTLEFDNLSKINLEKPGILSIVQQKSFNLSQKFYHKNKFFLSSSIFLFI